MSSANVTEFPAATDAASPASPSAPTSSTYPAVAPKTMHLSYGDRFLTFTVESLQCALYRVTQRTPVRLIEASPAVVFRREPNEKENAYALRICNCMEDGTVYCPAPTDLAWIASTWPQSPPMDAYPDVPPNTIYMVNGETRIALVVDSLMDARSLPGRFRMQLSLALFPEKLFRVLPDGCVEPTPAVVFMYNCLEDGAAYIPASAAAFPIRFTNNAESPVLTLFVDELTMEEVQICLKDFYGLALDDPMSMVANQKRTRVVGVGCTASTMKRDAGKVTFGLLTFWLSSRHLTEDRIAETLGRECDYQPLAVTCGSTLAMMLGTQRRIDDGQLPDRKSRARAPALLFKIFDIPTSTASCK
ncbi:hypothetical protein BDK51DRAFT_40441 [Blyttiomyces helicus]|uniref:Uncharacterized protein n=1 Tax=Blyttiomyces helicus TaxID=388810 RepID=A0A4P9WA57_9FUNG|nr:hypothetical protein BDK51DRAFT_40441 [Blyttiomyces helicus]|eukprot:RKO88415.1 hypothetical protein BDK51DRAFT_40441 [Blyttiomyces helicus]